MNLRTYEIIAQYIAREHGITVQLEPDISPVVCIEKKLIRMPSNIDPKHAYAALAGLMHEAAHIGHTRVPESVLKDEWTLNIINAMEDARIDHINFGRLPNVREFYRKMYEYLDQKGKEEGQDPEKIPMMIKSLTNQIVEHEGFPEFRFQDKGTLEWEKKNGSILRSLYREGIDCLENKDWKRLNEITEEILKLLDLHDKPRPPLPKEAVQGKGGGKAGERKMQAPGQMGKGDKGNGEGNEPAFGQGGDGTSTSDLGITYLKESTRERFKELLCQKETRRVDDGNVLNTESLTSFHLGDIEDLFKDEIILKRRKSKIQFLMDGSGSMGSGLPYSPKVQRRKVVSGCIKDLVQLLDEIRMIDGYDVDYDVSLFDSQYYRCQKHEWEGKYSRISGGTDLESSFKQAHKDLLEDKTIDGTKVLVLMTDGEVDDNEIKCMREELASKNEDVRFLIIGIGSDLDGEFVKTIVKEHNIVAEETADLVVLETIMDCLG